MKKCKKIVALLCLILPAALLSACGDSSEFQAALDSKDAAAAYSLYRQAYSDGKTDSCDEMLLKKIDVMTQTLNGASLDQSGTQTGTSVMEAYLTQQFGNLLNGGQYDLGDIVELSGSDVQTAYDAFEKLIASKESFLDGCYYLNQEDGALEACARFYEVLESDSLYQDAQAKIQSCVDAYIGDAVQEADQYFQKGDYEGGQKILDNARAEIAASSGESTAALDEYLTKSAQNYADQAAAYFSQGKAELAVTNMEIALRLAPNNADFKAKLEEYSTYVPLDLTVEQNILSNTVSCYKRNTQTANNGTIYKNALEISAFFSTDEEKQISYTLSGKYNKLSGTLFVDQDDKNDEGTMFFEIYGDGALIYTSPNFARGFLPQEFDVDITGVQNLKLKFYCTDWAPDVNISDFKASRTDLPQPTPETQAAA